MQLRDHFWHEKEFTDCLQWNVQAFHFLNPYLALMSTICLMVILSRIDVAIFSQFTAKGSNDDINSTILDVFEFISLPGVSSILINCCIKCASAMILAMNLLLSPEKLLLPFDHFSKSIFSRVRLLQNLPDAAFKLFPRFIWKFSVQRLLEKA